MVSFFQKIIQFLNEEEVPYMLTGSMAMSVYTVARSTQDFDFIVHLNSMRAERLALAFKPGYYCDLDGIKDAITHKSMFNVLEHDSGFKADFIILKDDAFQQLQFSRRQKVEILDTQAWVISGEDLILSKLIWMQESESGRQMQDITAVAKNPHLDWNYIHEWVKKMKLRTFNLF